MDSLQAERSAEHRKTHILIFLLYKKDIISFLLYDIQMFFVNEICLCLDYLILNLLEAIRIVSTILEWKFVLSLPKSNIGLFL